MTRPWSRATAGRRPVPTWAVLTVCCVAQFMVVLDITVVNVALPQMRHDLHLSVTGQQWVVNAYTLTFAGFLMLGGRAGDLFGRKRIFLFGLGLFTLCSLIGGLAESGTWLVAARAAQGVGGAVLAPSTLSLLTTRFTDPNKRRRALGAWATTAASGAAVGVLLGGVLTDLLSWRWVLFINVPIGIALTAAAVVALDESKALAMRRSLDLPGACTITAGLTVLIYGIVGTDTHPWGSSQTVGTLVLGALLLVAFVIVETKFASEPLVPFGIFRRRSLSIANGVSMTIGAAFFVTYFFLSLYLQQIIGYSPLRSGVAFLPAALATMTGSLVGMRVVVRLGVRRQLVIGPLLAATGLFWLSSLTPASPYWTHLLGPLLLVGIGLGSSFVPMTLAATTGVPHHEAGLASGLLNTTRQIGGAVGLAATATVAARAALHHGAGALSLARSAAALTSGYDRAFLISACTLVVGAGLATLLPPLRPAVPARDSDVADLAARASAEA